MKKYTLKNLEDVLIMYTDIIRNGVSSKFIKKRVECFSVLEYFEEYEKCMDLYNIIENK